MIALRNARIVTADEIVVGALAFDETGIRAIDTGAGAAAGSHDIDGDFLLPGLVELHTDNLERHARPRPGVRWPPRTAALAHDAEMIAAGVTTVYDAVSVGGAAPDDERAALLGELVGAVDALYAAGLLRAEHRLHLRCELSVPDVADEWRRFADHPRLGLVSLMDHTPGQRQFTSLDIFRGYYQGKYGLGDAAMDAFIDERKARGKRYSAGNRRAIAADCRARGLALASHDDATAAHVAEAADLGVRVAEFPTTEDAARASRGAGMAVLMGAPNLIRGRSHSGNVSARALAERGLVDILSSDYVPHSLLGGVFLLYQLGLCRLPAALAAASLAPARALGLDDRGEVAAGKRADLVRVRLYQGTPVVRAVWRGGERVL